MARDAKPLAGVKLWGGVAFVAAVYAFFLYEIARAITSGEVYARHLGWITYAEHPVSFVFNAAIAGFVLVALPLSGLYLWAVGRRRKPRQVTREDA